MQALDKIVDIFHLARSASFTYKNKKKPTLMDCGNNKLINKVRMPVIHEVFSINVFSTMSVCLKIRTGTITSYSWFLKRTPTNIYISTC